MEVGPTRAAESAQTELRVHDVRIANIEKTLDKINSRLDGFTWWLLGIFTTVVGTLLYIVLASVMRGTVK